MKVYEETWRIDDYGVIETTDGIWVTEEPGLGFPHLGDERFKLMATAPEMARLLIEVYNRIDDPLMARVCDVLEKAGVISVQRMVVTV